MKVLVVDDSMVMRKIIIHALESMDVKGADIGQAKDGTEGINLALNGNYDVILMDWNMPETTGIEAVRAIRKAGNKTPIIMVTTEGEKESVIEAIQAGANNYLVKPFESSALIEKINSLFQ